MNEFRLIAKEIKIQLLTKYQYAYYYYQLQLYINSKNCKQENIKQYKHNKSEFEMS